MAKQFWVASVVFFAFATVSFGQSQSVELNCLSDECTILVNETNIGTARQHSTKVAQTGFQQIKVSNKSYKDTYYCLTTLENKSSFPKELMVFPKGYIVNREDNQRNIVFDSLVLADSLFTHKYKGYTVKFVSHLTSNKLDVINEETKSYTDFELVGLEKKPVNLPSIKTQDCEKEINSLLHKTKFLSTKLNSNTIHLSCCITDYTFFTVQKEVKGIGLQNYYTLKASFSWLAKNALNDTLAVITNTHFSGEFIKNNQQVLLQDALESAYLSLYNYSEFTEHLDYNIESVRFDSTILIKQATEFARAPENVFKTVVTVERISEKIAKEAFTIKEVKDYTENTKSANHSSGFVISQDGYIITSADVFVTDSKSKIANIQVILHDRTTLPAEVVHFNVDANIALIKVDTSFNLVLKVPHKTPYKNMQKVYTMGTPKSIELGASISSGIVSNTRTKDDIEYIQLNMNVNDGNDGGPVYTQEMELIGVLSSKLKGFSIEGICFCIPVHRLEEYLNITISE